MKHLRIVAVVVIALLGMSAFAQDFPTTFTTSDGLSIGVPEGYESQEMMPGAAGVLDNVNKQGVIVFIGGALESFGLPSDVDAALIFDSLAALGGFEGDPAPVDLANGSGFSMAGEIPNFGPGVVVSVDAEFGLLVAFVVVDGGTPSEEFLVLANDIIGSVTFDPSAAVAVPTEEPVEEPTEIPSDTDTDTDTADSGCPIAVEDLPELTIQFCLGAQFEYPDNWSMFEGTEEVDTYASIATEGFGVSGIVTVAEISQYYNPQIYKEQSMTYLAEAMGDENYDPAESWAVLVEEEGKLIEVYDPREILELGGTDLVQINYLVTLNNDIFLSYTFTYIPDFSEESDVETIEGIVLSSGLTDFYTGTPVTIEFNGENTLVSDLECSSSTYGFNFTDDGIETYVVRCPICAGDEGSVWGTDIYTDDSSVCLAAAHAGAIDLEIGGLLLVTMSEGLEEYVGSEANGVTSSDYGTWGNSFSTAPFESGGTK